MADVDIQMGFRGDDKTFLRPVRVIRLKNGKPPASTEDEPPATTKVTIGQTVQWSSPAGVTVHFVHGPSPFAKSKVESDESPKVRKVVGLFPYDVVVNGELFLNGGGLEVGPKG